MSDDRAFLDSLRADPADDARWLVYADWLDDRDDPRAEYLRLVTHLASNPDPDRRRRLNAVRPTMPRAWLAELEQPAIIRANPTPYPASWPGVGLADVRPTGSTYAGNEYQALPPVPVEGIVRFEDWLGRVAADAPPGRRRPGDEDEGEDPRTAIPRLSAAANDFGLKLPDRFAGFFLDDRHPGLSRSPTDGFFNLPERIGPAPDCPEAGLIRFYSDSQGGLHWYLYLTPEGDECVVASDKYVGGSWMIREIAALGSGHYDPEEDEDVEEDEPGGEFWFCAPSFAEFVVRSWLENMAWYSLHPEYAGPTEARGARLPEVRAYLDHYRK